MEQAARVSAIPPGLPQERSGERNYTIKEMQRSIFSSRIPKRKGEALLRGIKSGLPSSMSTRGDRAS